MKTLHLPIILSLALFGATQFAIAGCECCKMKANEISQEKIDFLGITNPDKLSAASKRALARPDDLGNDWFFEYEVYDLKGDLESLLDLTRSSDSFSFRAASRDALHPGQTALVLRDEETVGYLGALHPSVCRELGLNAPTYVCEITLSALLQARLPAFSALSKFPEVRRDLALLVDKAVPAQELMENVRSSAGTYLTDLTLFDVYEGKGVDPKRKSLALGLTFRDSSRTLSDEDVNLAVDQVIDSLEKNYKAELRN